MVIQCIWEKKSERERTSVVQRTDVVSSESSSSPNKPCVPVISICKWPASLLGRMTERVKGGCLVHVGRLVPKLPGVRQCAWWGRGVESRRVPLVQVIAVPTGVKLPLSAQRSCNWPQRVSPTDGSGLRAETCLGLRPGCCRYRDQPGRHRHRVARTEPGVTLRRTVAPAVPRGDRHPV